MEIASSAYIHTHITIITKEIMLFGKGGMGGGVGRESRRSDVVQCLCMKFSRQ